MRVILDLDPLPRDKQPLVWNEDETYMDLGIEAAYHQYTSMGYVVECLLRSEGLGKVRWWEIIRGPDAKTDYAERHRLDVQEPIRDTKYKQAAVKKLSGVLLGLAEVVGPENIHCMRAPKKVAVAHGNDYNPDTLIVLTRRPEQPVPEVQ